MSILLYGCTTWTLTKRLENKLDGKYTRMLRAILNKSWRQHPTRHQLYGHLPPITKTIQVRRTRHAGHCWRRRDELIRDVLLWTPTPGRAKAGRPARTCIHATCNLEQVLAATLTKHQLYRLLHPMSSSLLLQQCPACLVRLTWIVFVMGCRWPYSWCLVDCCRQDLFNIARSILM